MHAHDEPTLALGPPSDRRPASPRRIVPSGPLGPPESDAPPPGMFRTTITPAQDLETTRARDGLPLPPRSLWRGYADSPARYLELAENHVRSMLSTLHGAAIAPAPGSRVLDFGCAAGPMLRVLHTNRPDLELWGCDIDPLAIDWCRRHLPTTLRLFTNTTAPHLPIPDATFDLIYAGSVFTHILYIADAWLLELARILKPGGILYTTIHDRAFIQHTIAHAPDWPFTTLIQRHFTQQTLASEWTPLTLGAGPNANAFYEHSYFIKIASPALMYIAHAERAYGDQTAIILTRAFP
ncbi:class I SAM-dependent methyltransferase [Nodularia spumigena]|uniref:class I SAM-dependent methyltransferase n=1 Tax=Nodularia spumigena TaxID=70799 RepID=UPI002B1EDD08|nr:class I SAM-dependent methyltransferase [Nodularia spumigena]MEA5557590.1 class I SAM-dependent methyltransferase [Nodularia spumigena CH309]